MESLTPHDTYLKNLKHQATTLASTGLSLITLFAEEANRLNREDEASRLKTLYSSIRQQLDQAKRSEDSASYGHSQANLVFSLSGLAVSGIIKKVSKNKKLTAFSDNLLKGLGNNQRPFGRVLVCIGPNGLPDDIRVISISQLARESNQQESQVINELQDSGNLLFNENGLSSLFEKLTEDALKGHLCLPIPKEKLIEITALGILKLKGKKSE